MYLLTFIGLYLELPGFLLFAAGFVFQASVGLSLLC